MLRTPRSTSRSGLAPRGSLLLALAGTGTVVFLVFLFPRLTSTAAEGRRATHAGTIGVAPGTASGSSADSPEAQLTVPPTAVEDDEAVGSALVATSTPLAASALTATNAVPGSSEPTGPKLTYEKREGQGKVEKVQPGELRAQQKQDAEQRYQQAVEKALANGEPPPPEPQRAPKARAKNKEKQPGTEKGSAAGRPAMGKKRGRAAERKKDQGNGR